MQITYDSQSLAVNKEDLRDVIAFLSEDRAPMYREFAKGKANATVHEWVEDKLRASAENAQVEGKTFTYEDATTETRKSNYCQIMNAEYSISGTQQAVDKVGAKDQLKRALTNAMKELARDAEAAAAGAGAGDAGDDSNPREMKSLLKQVASANVVTASGDKVLTEDKLNDLIEKVWTNTNPDSVFVSGKLKRAISKLSLSSGRSTEIVGGKLPSYVSTYESDFGLVNIYLDPEMADTDIYVTRKDMNEWAFLRPFHMVDGLAITGDAKNGVVLGELTVALRNSYASSWGKEYLPAPATS